MMSTSPLMELTDIYKSFGNVNALKGVSISINRGECHCLLGDNGAGKSTLIKIMSGVHQPTAGQVNINGKPTVLQGPREAIDSGIATVYQDLALVPLMSVTRNFFMGREPQKRWGPFKIFDTELADRVAKEKMAEIGIKVRDPHQAVGTMSGGERQCLAIARAIYFGAKVLILDEPTAALGVKQSSIVLRFVAKARAQGLAVIFITHNVHHAYPIADKFTMLNRGQNMGTFRKSEVSREDVLSMMAGGQELKELDADLDEFSKQDKSQF
mgnify:FL=1